MDEINQMYIIKEINEENRKVEFNSEPITPEKFVFHYGGERMNSYNKKEMTDRLEKSLKEKGMTLQ